MQIESVRCARIQMLSQEGAVRLEKSKKLFEEAVSCVPEGVASEGMRGGRPYPIFIQRGTGSKFYDVDGNCFIDHFLSAGPLILGHANPKLIRAVAEQLEKGSILYGGNELLITVAKRILKLVPCVEKVSFSSSGTEAVLNALRIARGYTGREKILKFEGQYHGWHDQVSISTHSPLAVAGLEVAPHRIPDSAGMLRCVMDSVIVAPWNDLQVLEKLVEQHKHELAAVLTAPIPYSMGVAPAKEGYLKAMREITEQNGIVLIFDEVFNGFREALGGGQEKCGVTPDLCTMGKAMSGGFPISAVGGKAEVMNVIGENKVTYGGTFNGNAMCLAACETALQELEGGGLKRVHEVGGELLRGVEDLVEDTGVDAVIQGSPPAFTIFFTKQEKIENWRQFVQLDRRKIEVFEEELLRGGAYITATTNHKFFTSTAHTSDDVKTVLEGVEKGLKKVKSIDTSTRSNLA